MASPSVIKFRCYQCNQLLGASRSKVGAVVSCRKCGAELIVPVPSDAPSGLSSDGEGPAIVTESTASAQGSPDSALPADLIDIRPEDIRVEPGFAWAAPPVDASPAPPAPAAPIESPGGRFVEETPVVATGGREPYEPASNPHPYVPPPYVPPPSVPPQAAPASTPPVVPAAEAVLPPIKVEPPRFVDRSPAPRSRDVMLPRSAVAAWSLFVLMALWLAFVAGLLSGHYLWRVH